MGKRGPRANQLAKLFRLKYLQGIGEKHELAERLGVQLKTVYCYEGRLEKKLVEKIRQVSPDRLRFVCPECLEARVYGDPETGERVCMRCGYVVEQQPVVVHRLPFDQTYAFENPLVFNKSLGGTVSKKHLGKVLTRVRNTEEKTEAITQIVAACRKGKLPPIEAAREIREILVTAGAEEIAQVITEIKEPQEGARRIINMFDAIPIRQIMTLHDIHEPLLIRKMKEYAEKFRKQSKMDMPNPVCDPNLFSVALGRLVEKVGSEALLNPKVKHNPKDLALACFFKTVRMMNPSFKVEGRLASSLKEDAAKYVDRVIQILGSGGEKVG